MKLLLVVALAVSVGAQGGNFDACFTEPSGTQQPSTAPSNEFSFTGVDVFGLQLFRQLVSAKGLDRGSNRDNLLVSPYSIWSVLNLALMGAQGRTRDELQRALGVPQTKVAAYRTKFALDFLLKVRTTGNNGGPEMRLTDAAYFNESLQLRPCVTKIIHKVKTLDFSDSNAAANLINNDVEIFTGGQIKNLIDAGALARAIFVLVNAVYFKGTWEYQFAREMTRTKEFHVLPQGLQTLHVPTMSQQGRFNLAQASNLGSRILELPYSNSNISMLIILPDDEVTGMTRLLSALTPSALTAALQTKRLAPVKVSLPKFDLETRVQTELIQSLVSMGIKDIFDGSKADFSDFTPNDRLFVSDAIHQSKVKVDEEGTVASAVTVLVGTRAGPGQFINFEVNRPFVFLIYENVLKVTIFAGVVNNPAK